MTEQITLESTISVPEDVLFREVEGEAVLLNTASGKYFGLDEVGTRMWTLLAEHGQVEPAYRALLEEYDVAPEQLQQDLLDLVGKLVAHGLIRVTG
jgi:hypothetical protein